MVPPLVLDIDGTLTRAGSDRSPPPIDPRVCDRLADWDAPILLATGKSFPYPVALCQFLGIDRNLIAENGGIVCVGTHLEILGDPAAARAVTTEMTERGHPPSPGGLDLLNRWRETEVAFKRITPLGELQEVAASHGLHVVDTGYAYHVKDPAVTKGGALAQATAAMEMDPAAFVAIGDSPNDISIFERVGHAIAVANADDATREAADRVTTATHADGAIEAIDGLRATR